MITNIYNKKTKGPTLMEFFTLEKREVSCTCRTCTPVHYLFSLYCGRYTCMCRSC